MLVGESRLPFLVIGFLFFIMIDHDQNDDYSVFLDTADNLTEINYLEEDGEASPLYLPR